MKHLLLFILLAGLFASTSYAQATPDANGVLYVKKSGGGTGLGNNWANPISELADALNSAMALNNTTPGTVKQIWVAAGTYYPQTTLGGSADNRAKSFLLLKDVKIYGSFAGTETDTAQRNVNAYLTTLSGDLGIATDYSDNSYHVVTAVGDAGTATLNGFVVSGGNANGSNNVTVNGEIVYFNYGGGIYMMKSNLLINNVSFYSNTAQYGGAAMIFVDQGATFKDVGFFSNTAAQGGACYINSAGTPAFERVAFIGNNASAVGGAVRIGNNCRPTFKSVQFTGNKATTYGSSIYNASNITISITNGTISGNNDGWGTIYSLTGSKVSLQNSIVYGNSAGIYNTDGSSNTIQYSLVQGLGADAANNNLDGSVNPLFAAPASYNNAPTTLGNYTLQSASPAINAGSNALYDALDAASLDAFGLPRVHNYASGGKIDMGAHEYQGLDLQSITAANTTKNYGDVAFEPTASASSGLALTFQSSDNNTVEPFIDAADGNKLKLKIKKAGTATITASQAGNSDYAAAPDAQFTVTVNKAALTVTAKDASKAYDGLAYSGGNGVTYSGFVNGDDSTSALTGMLTYSGTSQTATGTGVYPITPAGLAADNYSITYTNGSLRILLATDANGIMYVKKGSTGNGSSWANAIGEPADALRSAAIMNAVTAGAVKQIWVAKGTYLPMYPADNVTAGSATNTDLKNSFVLLKDVKVYGGFAGTETDTASRDLSNTANATILSGDIGVAGTSGDNAYHVVIAAGDVGNALISGFTISDGAAGTPSVVYVNTFAILNFSGGGIAINKAALLVEDVLLTNNAASNGGACCVTGDASQQASAVFTRVHFVTNTATTYGGALYSTYATVTLNNVNAMSNTAGLGGVITGTTGSVINCSNSSFTDNQAATNGGVMNFNTPVTANFTNSEFLRNSATSGGVFYTSSTGTAFFANVKMSGNTATAGAVVLTSSNSAALNFTMINAELTGNKSSNYGAIAFPAGFYQLANVTMSGNSNAAIYNDGGTCYLRNSLIYGNASAFGGSGTSNVLSMSNVQGATPDAARGISSTDPLFTNMPAYATAPFTNGNYALQQTSTAIDAGLNGYYTSISGAPATDLAGNTRIFNGSIDRGAYEVVAISQTIAALVDTTATYGAVFTRTFSASSGLPVTVTSADNAIAEAYLDAADNTWKIKAKKAGPVNITVSQPGGSGYAAAADVVFALTINKAALTITAKDTAKTYNGLVFTGGNGVSYSGFVNGDDSTAALTGSLVYSGTSQGAKNVNNYTIVPGGLSANNYSLTYANGALTISKAALTVTAKDSSKTYDGLTFSNGNGVTYSGFVNNEDSTQALTGALTYSGTSQGAKDVNNYTIVPGGLSANNYSLTYANGALTISKAALTVTAKDSSKVYDGLTFSNGNGVTYTGFVNNEDSTQALTGTLAYSGTSQGAKNVNSYTIIPGGLLANNYSLNYVNGTLTIGKAALTITAKDSSKTYDGIAFNGGNGITYAGFVNNETSADLTGTLIYSGTSQGATSVNNYVIAPGGLTSGNYDISYVNGNLTINKAALTITAKDSSKVYDAVAFNGGNGITYSGFVNNETSAALGGTLTYSGTSQNAVNTGNYVITPSGLTSGNYNIQYANGSLSITKAALKITAEDKTKVYGDADPALTYVATGWATGDGNSLITGALKRLAGENVGNFAINQNTLSAGNNYIITYTAGNFAITPATLTITADTQTKVYGTADPVLTFVATGWKNGDDGTNGSLTREAGENVGTYAIQQGTIGAGANYTIAFVGNNLTITKAPQLITWNQDLTIGCTTDINPIALNATANSGLAVSYAISSTDVGTISGSTLTPVLPGYAVITASQAGDANHFAAPTVTNNVNYRSASTVQQHWSDVLMFDNSSNNFVKWEWYKNNSLVSGQTSAYYSEPTALSGTYYVIATDKNGEAIQSCPLTLNGSATVTAGIKVYPNPVTAGSATTVTCNYTDAALQGAKMAIVDMSGKIQQEITNVKATQTIIAPSARGMYYITLLLKNGQKASVNLLVK